MNDEKVVVTDDWTRNWQAKVAIKITAMFLWVIILGGFATVIYFTSDLGSRIEQDVSRDLDAIAYHAQAYLVEHPPADESGPDWLQQLVIGTLRAGNLELGDESEIIGLQFSMGETSIGIGNTDAGLGSNIRHLYLPAAAGGDTGSQVQLKAYFLSAIERAERTRQQLIITVIVIMLVFGMLLSMTIQNVLAKPFQVIMDAIQSVSNGDLNLRLNVSGEDEFGRLSRFFNQMLDRVQDQQEELTEANMELTSEVVVRKQAEEKLRAHQNELEKVIEERTSDLAVARDQALAASQTKSAFIANVSHEIRTPLAPIIGFAEAMLNGGQDRDEQEQSLRTIIRNGKHLSQIINEILDLSKIEADCLEFEKIPVDPFALVADVESVGRILAEEKGLEFDVAFEFPLPHQITSDPTRIKQILINLVTNAVKFTEKGQVRILVKYRQADRLLAITVLDSGIGIPAEKIGRMFKAFSQADSSTTRRYGGTGLGLHISKRLAGMLGGDITLESVSGVGTRFTVTIDVGETEGPELVHELPDGSGAEGSDSDSLADATFGGRVLLAEDSPDIQRLMVYLLERVGTRVDVVENGKLAVEEALRTSYDIILMDMQMPVMSGVEAITLLRGSGCATPIAALTANAMKEDRAQYFSIGCNAFLAKPVDRVELQKVLREYLPVEGTAGEKEVELMSEVDSGEQDDEFSELIAEFLAGLDDYSKRISAALDESRFDVARELAHQLKGMGSSFGYPGITRSAADFEAVLKAGDSQAALEPGRALVALLQKTASQPTDVAVG